MTFLDVFSLLILLFLIFSRGRVGFCCSHIPREQLQGTPQSLGRGHQYRRLGRNVGVSNLDRGGWLLRSSVLAPVKVRRSRFSESESAELAADGSP